jgi:hypothetical protein
MAQNETNLFSEVVSISWKWILWLCMLIVISTYLVSMALEHLLKALNYLLKLIIQSKNHDK